MLKFESQSCLHVIAVIPNDQHKKECVMLTFHYKIEFGHIFAVNNRIVVFSFNIVYTPLFSKLTSSRKKNKINVEIMRTDGEKNNNNFEKKK